MGLRSVAPGPNTSRKHPAHALYPYLLRHRVIDAANQVWCADVTYIPLAHGFAYLVAIMDWHTRHVLSWRLSTTQDALMCVEPLKEALANHGKPEIFNTDQGSQFTSEAWTGMLNTNDIQISMDGKGCWVDNVFIERQWRSLKHECVYLSVFDSVRDARDGIG
jgi:putative transposase